MIKFEKVSYEQFKEDLMKNINSLAKPINSEEQIQVLYDNIKLPKRSSIGSAGYDFYSPVAVTVNDACSPIIPTGIRVKLSNNYVLMLMARSGIGFKTGTQLSNTIGIIDSDYYYSNNEGHIMLKLVKGFKDLTINQGDRIAQGIFTVYLLADDDSTKAVRNGGFGSSGD